MSEYQIPEILDAEGKVVPVVTDPPARVKKKGPPKGVSNNPAGRKAWIITPEVFEDVIGDICSGTIVHKALRARGIKDYKSFYHHLKTPELRERYLDARKMCMDALADQGLEMAMNAKLDHNHKRVALDYVKWIISKINPERYGERVGIDMNVKGSISISIVTAAPSVLPQLTQGRVIDADAHPAA